MRLLRENRILVAVFVAGLLASPAPTHAGNLCRSYLMSFFELVTQSFEGRRVDLGDGASIRFGSKLGNGMGGVAYRVAGLEGVRSLAAYDPEHLVVKMPLAFRRGLGGFPLPHSAFLQKEEISLTERAGSQIREIESSRFFPEDSYWERGRLPAAPIVGQVQTRYGPLIFKPLVAGVALPELVGRHGTQLPPPMLESLRQIHALAQAVHERVTVRGLSMFDVLKTPVTRHVVLDINASNLIWVEDAQQMKSLGLKRPGFVLFEIGEISSATLVALDGSFADYLEQIRQFVEIHERLGD